MANKAYYQLHKEEIKRKSREYYHNNKETSRAVQRVGRLKFPRKVKSSQLQIKYGITLEEYEKKLLAQNGQCQICQRPIPIGRNSHLDHDHLTGKLRDFLCRDCNFGLGRFKDQPELLRKAAEYLEMHKD